MCKSAQKALRSAKKIQHNEMSANKIQEALKTSICILLLWVPSYASAKIWWKSPLCTGCCTPFGAWKWVCFDFKKSLLQHLAMELIKQLDPADEVFFLNLLKVVSFYAIMKKKGNFGGLKTMLEHDDHPAVMVEGFFRMMMTLPEFAASSLPEKAWLLMRRRQCEKVCVAAALLITTYWAFAPMVALSVYWPWNWIML